MKDANASALGNGKTFPGLDSPYRPLLVGFVKPVSAVYNNSFLEFWSEACTKYVGEARALGGRVLPRTPSSCISVSCPGLGSFVNLT